MNHRTINKRIIDYLRDISDDKEVVVDQNKHIKVTGCFRGRKRSMVLFCSPSSCYQTYLRSALRRFLKSLEMDLDLTPRF